MNVFICWMTVGWKDFDLRNCPSTYRGKFNSFTPHFQKTFSLFIAAHLLNKKAPTVQWERQRENKKDDCSDYGLARTVILVVLFSCWFYGGSAEIRTSNCVRVLCLRGQDLNRTAVQPMLPILLPFSYISSA